MSTGGALRDGDERRAAVRRGRRGELRAIWLLRLKGYRILARDLRTPAGEIDIVARRGGTLAMIEVKWRDSWEDAAIAVTARQQTRIAAAARLFLARHSRHAQCVVRFDIMLVVPRRWPRHVVNAWQIDRIA